MPAPRHEVSVTAVVLALAGSVVLWAGVKGVSIGSGVRTLLGGHAPVAPDETLISVAEGLHDTAVDSGEAADALRSSGNVPIPGVSDSHIASVAASFVGSGTEYHWGGAAPSAGGRGWDCSGFVNYVLATGGIPIPGYPNPTKFNWKTTHGPVTAQWAIWSGCVTIPRAQVAAGDLVVWPGVHMAIAANNTQMITCPGPNGTPAPVIQTIDRAHLGPLMCRRLIRGS